MEKQQFYNLMDDLKSKKLYDEVDLYNICNEFKNLPRKDKKDITWNHLAKYLNLNKSGDALRKWYERRHKLNVDCEKLVSKDQETMTLLKNQKEEFPQVDDESKFREDYIILSKNRDILNSYRRMLREEARIDILKDEIKNSVSMLNSLPEQPKYEHKYVLNESEGIALLSDLHIGVTCNNYYNKYNLEIAQQRLDKWVDNVIDYCIRENITRLNILNLGDMVHGLIHTNARIEQEFDVVSQVMLASELLAKTLNKLSSLPWVEVIYRSVSDNHSRTSANLSEHIEKENFHRLIDWYLKERLKSTSIKFDDNKLDDSLGLFTTKNGKIVCYAHGHLDKKTSVIQDISGLTRQVPDIVCLAHYHNSSEHSFQGSKMYVNGSIVGTEQYAFSKRLFSDAEQKLIILQNSNIIDININLQ